MVIVEQGQQYASNFLEARASFAAAQANEEAAKKQLPVLRAQRALADAQLGRARARLQQAGVSLARTSHAGRYVFGRSRSRASGSTTNQCTSARDAKPIGTLMKKIQCQE